MCRLLVKKKRKWFFIFPIVGKEEEEEAKDDVFGCTWMGFEEGGDWRSIGGVQDDAIAEQESGSGGGHSSSLDREPKRVEKRLKPFVGDSGLFEIVRIRH